MGEQSTRFQQAWRILHNKYKLLKQNWNDPVQRNFDKRYWQGIEQSANPLSGLLETLEKDIQEAERNCPKPRKY